MKTMERFYANQKLANIKELYLSLKDGERNNVFIGGSVALLLHGLVLDKEPDDIDVIIYDASAEQLKKVELLKTVSSINSITAYKGTKSLKIEKDKMIINILLEDNFPLDFYDFMYYKFIGVEFVIGGIENTMSARRKYCNRKKDLISSLKLKELNFNIITDDTNPVPETNPVVKVELINAMKV